MRQNLGAPYLTRLLRPVWENESPFRPSWSSSIPCRMEASERRRFARCRTAPVICLVLLGIPFILSMVVPWLTAQTAPTPELHRRADSQAVEEADSVTISRGTTTLPADASGSYSLGKNGEAVEIDLQPDRLTGYISRLGDQLSDQGAPLTFFFATSVLRGRDVSFTTRQVHGAWFSFTGAIVRGSAATRSQDGYYRLEGSLALHDAANGTAQTREVSLPLMRQDSAG